MAYKSKKYSLYVLINNGRGVYLGCSCNVKNRVSKHKEDKVFDDHIVIKTYDTKKEALASENAIIHFLAAFGDSKWYNMQGILVTMQANEKGVKNG